MAQYALRIKGKRSFRCIKSLLLPIQPHQGERTRRVRGRESLVNPEGPLAGAQGLIVPIKGYQTRGPVEVAQKESRVELHCYLRSRERFSGAPAPQQDQSSSAIHLW